MKTEASQKPVPMAGELASVLQDWNAQSAYRHAEDWVFASPKMNGKQPYRPDRRKTFGHREADRLAFISQDVRHASKGQR